MPGDGNGDCGNNATVMATATVVTTVKKQR